GIIGLGPADAAVESVYDDCGRLRFAYLRAYVVDQRSVVSCEIEPRDNQIEWHVLRAVALFELASVSPAKCFNTSAKAAPAFARPIDDGSRRHRAAAVAPTQRDM